MIMINCLCEKSCDKKMTFHSEYTADSPHLSHSKPYLSLGLGP